MRSAFLVAIAAAALLAASTGCKPAANGAATDKGEPMSIKITSTAFAQGQAIPKKHTGEGEDISPQLAWSGLPDGAAELALVMDDPDAPGGTWTHWVVYDIPATLPGLDEGASGKDAKLPDPAIVDGKNSFPTDNIRYRGPMPPKGHGAHHYYFTLYALDKKLSLAGGADAARLQQAMQGHILAKGQLMGTYQRD